MMHKSPIHIVVCCAVALLLAACSTISNMPEGDVLYTGIKSIDIHDRHHTDAEELALVEVEAALAHEPNNAFMGSSSLRTPLPIGLWVYNSMINKEHTAFGRWLLNSFGTPPVTIASVAPATRTKVATNLLQNYGYFNGYVDYELVNQSNPKKQKIRYDVHLGEPYLLDSIRYMFTGVQDSIVRARYARRTLKSGMQFSVPDLETERERITTDFRNQGFYYYRPDYIRFIADSVQKPQRVQLLVAPDLDTPELANRRWYIGNIHTYIRSSSSAVNLSSSSRNNLLIADSLTRIRAIRRLTQYDDSIVLNGLKYAYQGNKEPVKPRVLFKNFMFNRKQRYSQQRVERTITNLSNMKVFSQLQFTFTPRDSSLTCDTLDVRFNAVMDKLIDTELDFSFTQKSNAQVGPRAGLKIAKRNAFGHGETLAVGLKGSYEWQTGSTKKIHRIGNTRPDSWEAGMDASLTYPWLVFPGLSSVAMEYGSQTTFSVSVDNLKRAGYYRLLSFGANATYNFNTSRRSSHQFTPLSVTYNQLMQTSEYFDSIATDNSALLVSLRDQFVPAMQYVYTYDNGSRRRRKKVQTRFQGTIKEAGNLVSCAMVMGGRSMGERDKKLLGTPYSQFIKFNAEMTNTWRLTETSQLVTRYQVGSLWSYGNSRYAPYSELFYVGGANSIRAFGVRTIGPGSYRDRTGRGTYLDQAGDFRLEANAEYRFNIISNLNGALFLDAGNVWMLRDDKAHPGGSIHDNGFLKTIAVGTGAGLRYDLEFLVLRLDLGIGIHAPYDTGKNGYYNIKKFGDGLGFHFAVGYPF